MLDLFTTTSDEAMKFRKHIKLYNSIFAFTSFGLTLDKELASGRRVSALFVHKDKYIMISYQKMVIHTTNKMRNVLDGQLNENTMKKLMKVLKDNPYAQFFKSLNDACLHENLVIKIVANVKPNQRVYNTPIADEVGAIWVEDNNPSGPLEREIIIHAHSGVQI